MQLGKFPALLLLCLMPVTAAHAQAPSFTHTIPLSGSVDADTVSVRVNGTAAILSGTLFNADIDLQFGTNIVLVEAADAAGNTSQVMLTLLLNLPQSQSAACCSVTIGGNVADASAVSVNGVPAAIIGPAFVADVELSYGVNQVLAAAVNANGNQSTHQIHLFVNAENTPPVILSTVPGAPALLTAGDAFATRIEAEDAEQHFLYYRSAIGAQPLSDWKSEFEFVSAVEHGVNGYQTLRLEVLDAAGAAAATDVPVYVAREPGKP